MCCKCQPLCMLLPPFLVTNLLAHVRGEVSGLKPKTLAQISGASLCKNWLKERPTPSGGLGLGFVTFSSVGQFFDWKTTRMHERSYS